MLVEKLDLSDLHRFEQARDHSVELLEKWLSTYKFKNWHKTNSKRKTVTQEMKKKRAKKIALKLNDTKRWHAHSRGISIEILQNELNLKIEDMSEKKYSDLHNRVKQTHSFIVDFMETTGIRTCLRTARFIDSEEYDEEKRER